MRVEFIASFSPIVADPNASTVLYRETLGLPLEGEPGGYQFSEQISGVKHFGVWPLKEAARSCFGRDTWPSEVPVPQASLEFELADVAAVRDAVDELRDGGLVLIHEPRLEEWGQTIARYLSPDGLLLGVCYTPWMHPSDSTSAE
jgi:catechol 2,3-dioxygenase-like lactoylglutathione lyase family enzyme